MSQPLPSFVKDISLTLTVAAAVVIFSQWLGIPVVVAYIFSGMLVGPHTAAFPTVVNIEQIRTLSELGIIFLLFGLGLEFSFRKLFRLGWSVLLIGVFEVLGAVFIGSILAQYFGLDGAKATVFGFLVSISSTGVIVKLLQERKLLKVGFAQTVIGVLIVEDLFAILFLLLLSVLKDPNFATITTELGLLFGVSTIWIVLGTIMLPSLVKSISKYLTDEVLTVASLGFCLGIVLFASEIGVSSALAAFLCGSILAETDQQHRIEEITRPIRHFFTAIFFVSMGMLVDPIAIFNNFNQVIALVFIVLTLKTLLPMIGSILVGKNFVESLRTGFTMGQIGEFSIIIASLAVVKGFLPSSLESILVGAVAILILITGFVSKVEDKLAHKLEGILPKSLKNYLDRYRYALSHFERNPKADKEERTRKRLKLIQCTLIVLAIFVVAKFIVISTINNPLTELFIFIAATILSSPFLFWMSGIWYYRKKKIAAGLIARRVSVEEILRLSLTIIFYMFVAFLLLPDFITLFFVGLVGMALSYLFSQQLHKANTWVFKRLKNESKIPDLEESFPKGGPWDEHLIAITVHPLSSAVEKTLIELDLRNQFGVNVIFHQRADRRVVAPPGDTRLYPSDVLLLMGSEESLSIVERLLSSNHCLERTEEIQEKFIIHSARIEPDSAWDGKELGDLDIQNTLRAVIVAIEQNQDQKIITPAAHTKIEKGDLVWLAMDKSRLDLLDLFVRAIPT